MNKQINNNNLNVWALILLFEILSSNIGFFINKDKKM